MPETLPHPLAPDSVVDLHELVCRPDQEEGWIIGRAATGEFVALPDEAKTVIDVLRTGETIAAAKRRADAEHGADLDVLDFVADLIELGFVAAVSGHTVADGVPRPPSLPWLRPRQVRWIFTWPVAVLVAGFVAAGFAAGLAAHVMPTATSFFALGAPGLNMLVAAALASLILVLHEFWHLAAARAAGVDGWLGWGTRLIFLVAQTSVPGLWAAGRRVRIRVFLAGMISDLVVAAGSLFGAAATPTGSIGHRLCAALCLNALLTVAMQSAVFMRTDLYLVIQELAMCKNLYSDAVARLRWLAARWRSRLGGPAATDPDPTLALPAREQRPVRIYAVVVALGSLSALAIFCGLQLPIAAGTIVRAVEELSGGLRVRAFGRVADAVLVLGVTALFQGLFLRTYLRKRRQQG